MALDRIDIPAEARRPKPDFPTLPTREIVEEVRAWLKAGNPTYLWRGHTHTEPRDGEPIEYAGDFKLPKGVEAPCPCCTPVTPKFSLGLIAWFPETNLIRLMGQHCFRRLNPLGHQAAFDRMQERQKREADVQYLLKNLPKQHNARRIIEGQIDLAQHLDDLREIFGPKLRNVLRIDLWTHLRDGGALKITQETNDEGTIFIPYASIRGANLLDPNRRSFADQLRAALKFLDAVTDFGPVKSLDDEDRRRITTAFSRAMSTAKSALVDMEEARQFVSVQTTATLRNWGKQRTAPIRLYIRREKDRTISIGQSEDAARKITLRECIDRRPPELPAIETT